MSVSFMMDLLMDQRSSGMQGELQHQQKIWMRFYQDQLPGSNMFISMSEHPITSFYSSSVYCVSMIVSITRYVSSYHL